MSSRRQIKIKEVRDNILILPDNEYRTIIETSSINFELKSEDEQDTLIDSFQNFLNALSIPVQILIRIREIDVDSYLEELIQNRKKETEEVYKKQMKHYAEFIHNLISGNKILSRRFYIIIPYTPENLQETKDLTLIKEQLHLQQDIIIKGLEKLGMKAKTLTSLEILDLFYSFYNPQKAKQQPVTQKALAMLTCLPI